MREKLTGTTHILPTAKKDERKECQTAPAHDTRGPAYRPETFRKTSEPSNQRNWIPGTQGLDPRCTETRPGGTKPQDPASQTRTKDFAEARTSWDSGLHGFRTTREPGLRRIQDFARLRTSWGFRTPQGIGTLHTRTRILFCGDLSENTNFPD